MTEQKTGTTEEKDVAEWLAKAIRPAVKNKLQKAKRAELDKKIVAFVCDTQHQSVTWSGHTSRQRAWIHQACACFGLESKSAGEGDHRTITLSKPSADWTLDLTKQPIKLDCSRKKRHRERKAVQMAKWHTQCEGCGSELDAYDALYSVRFGGPMCIECVENDEELSGFKWEPKSEFWSS